MFLHLDLCTHWSSVWSFSCVCLSSRCTAQAWLALLSLSLSLSSLLLLGSSLSISTLLLLLLSLSDKSSMVISYCAGYWVLVGVNILNIEYVIVVIGWEIHLEFCRILRLIWFRTFWTLEFSSEFYFSARKMCSRQFWTRFLRFGILSCHRFFQFHESENVPTMTIFLAHHVNIQSYISAGIHNDA